ncbi:MAG: hypothetical protein JWQ04_406 [Pedosphaera sp.]|nr:hypothetical protein [Pedosphaera sp.]
MLIPLTLPSHSPFVWPFPLNHLRSPCRQLELGAWTLGASPTARSFSPNLSKFAYKPFPALLSTLNQKPSTIRGTGQKKRQYAHSESQPFPAQLTPRHAPNYSLTMTNRGHQFRFLRAAVAAGLLASGLVDSRLAAKEVPRLHALDARPFARAYLQMPARTNSEPPPLLSQTGAFKDVRRLIPADSLIPYDLNVAFWSDGASKSRWISVPHDAGSGSPQIGFAPTGEWTFPNGTVFVKHFEIATDETRPEIKRRLETRLLVRDADGSVYGATYKWRTDNSDADLLISNLTEDVLIKTATGTRTQAWYYPSRQDCRTCHTDLAGGVLGVKTRQMNRELAYPNGVTENQLRAWDHIGLLSSNFNEAQLPAYPKLAAATDLTRSLEDRARSYLDANCAHCHRPGGTVAYFDARYDTPLSAQKLIEGQVLINQGVDNAWNIAPNDIWRSIIFMRVNTVEAIRMPPLARATLDRQGVELLRQWIESLPGPPVLAPVSFLPRGGNFPKPIETALSQTEPGAVIHYTLDGSTPTKSDPVYEKPIKLDGPVTVRAKAFKPGFTKSIASQETFIIGE